ncbi:MAG TPA: hypothetical protein VF384_17360 [Planctomycetota bacterium]
MLYGFHLLLRGHHDLPAEVLAGDGEHPFLVPPSQTQAPRHTAITDDGGRAVLTAPASGRSTARMCSAAAGSAFAFVK